MKPFSFVIVISVCSKYKIGPTKKKTVHISEFGIWAFDYFLDQAVNCKLQKYVTCHLNNNDENLAVYVYVVGRSIKAKYEQQMKWSRKWLNF